MWSVVPVFLNNSLDDKNLARLLARFGGILGQSVEINTKVGGSCHPDLITIKCDIISI